MCDSSPEGLVGLDEPRIYDVLLTAVVGLRVCCDVVESEVSGRSDTAGNGPSSASAGDTGRLPGIVSSVRPLVGADCMTVSRAWGSTFDVSHVSKPSACGLLSMIESTCDKRASLVRELRCLTSFVRDVIGRTTWCTEYREDLKEPSDSLESFEIVGDGGG